MEKMDRQLGVCLLGRNVLLLIETLGWYTFPKVSRRQTKKKKTRNYSEVKESFWHEPP